MSCKFGAHPSFAIALERSLTEMFQGTHLKYASLVNEITIMNTVADSELNLQNIVKVGVGSYPTEFFGGDFSYSFQPFPAIENINNQNLVARLLNPLIESGYNVLIRDNSILDFPSFQIVIPGFSEIYAYSLFRMKEKRSHDKVRKIMRNIHSASNEELSLLAVYIQYKKNYYNENSIPYLFGLPLKDKFRFGSESLTFLLVLIYIKLDKLTEAIKYIQIMLNILIYSKTTEPEDVTYLRCLRDYLSARMDNKIDKEIIGCFSKVYPHKILKEIIIRFKDNSKIFNHFFLKSNCWDCKNCELSKDCDYLKIEEIYLQIKTLKKNDPIDQSKLKVYFQNFQTWST
ncbi:MAG: YcaO-like family protein [Spirochaetaceae bacterium]|nr:YcaO-like family protein [Spirochaetaceae bacterium]